MDIPKRGLGVEETAKVIGIGRTKVYDEINSGRLKAHKVGRRTIIFVEDIQAYRMALPEKEIAADQEAAG
ncbi:helix-turn-helix domain-containing protein [Sinorhizobium fredii]|uniref:helix-turn-helix domain-containing protein n=1 Tax=Rhizobium fredii TaxID=380 RepID=UPI0005955EED|nr:helix-turn-helix domain-containing protein [Sinorhizobium fredii]WOS64258.1 helix-turn-helix domain-containing protein [Sinorhizobium fredii GR64]